MSLKCKCSCRGTCDGPCACTIDDSGSLAPVSYCWYCATAEAQRTQFMPHWFITSLACVKNTVPEEGVDIGILNIVDLTIAQGGLAGAVTTLTKPVRENEPTDIAAGGPYKWIPDPTLRADDSLIKNATPALRLLQQVLQTDSVTEYCVTGANAPGSGISAQRTNGWHIGFGYERATDFVAYLGRILPYDFYPTKPPVIPLVPNVPYVYGAIFLDTNVRLSFTNSDTPRICLNAIVWLRAEFCLGRVAGSDPVQYRYLYYNIPIWEHDGRKSITTFCDFEPICLSKKRVTATASGLEEHFTGGKACVAPYKWKFNWCNVRRTDTASSVIEVVPATITRSANAFYVDGFFPNLTLNGATVNTSATVDWEGWESILGPGPGISYSATITPPCGAEPYVRSFIQGSFAPETTVEVTASGWQRLRFLRYDTTVFIGKWNADGSIETFYGEYRSTDYLKIIDSLDLGASYAVVADITSSTAPNEYPSFTSVEEVSPSAFLDLANRILPHVRCNNCWCIPLYDSGEEFTGGEGSEVDSHWEVETANGSGVFMAAKIVATDPAWLTPREGATWIGIGRETPPAGGSPWSGVRLFRYRFNLTEVLDADLKAKFAIDNTADTISINGTVIATSAGAFSSRTAVVIPASDLVVGMNELLIEASDDGAVAGLLWEWDES